jgi:hypothetical protein
VGERTGKPRHNSECNPHVPRRSRRANRSTASGESWLPWASQPELGTNTASLRAPNRPLSGSAAFLGHLGLNTVQKSKGKAKNPLNGARQ